MNIWHCHRFDHLESTLPLNQSSASKRIPRCTVEDRLDCVVAGHTGQSVNTSHRPQELDSGRIEAKEPLKYAHILPNTAHGKYDITFYFHILTKYKFIIWKITDAMVFQWKWLFFEILRLHGRCPTWFHQTEYVQCKTWYWNKMLMHISGT